MEIVSSISSEPRQKFSLTLEGGGTVQIYLYYYQSQYSWYFDFEYNGYVCRGNKVVLSFNTLRHLRERLPFGIGFLSTSLSEPFSVNSFENGDVRMLLMNKEDVQMWEDYVYAKI